MVFNTMRRAGAILWLALAAVQSISAISIQPERARLHAEAFRNTYPRPEGSTGERQALDYIATVLDAAGARYEVRDFSELANGHSFSRIVDVIVQGSSPQTILLVAPLNHPDRADPDEDRSASIAAALALVEAAVEFRQPLTYRVLFLGAEFGDSPPYPLGTRLFASNYFPDEHVLALYLDVSQPGVVIETGGAGRVTPSWLVSAAKESAHAAGLMPKVRSSLNQLHRLGISDPPEPLAHLLAAGVPAVYLRSQPGPFAPAHASETAARLTSMLARLAGSFEQDIPSQWDRHYLFFSLGRSHLVIPETVYLVVLLGVFFAMLLYALISRRQLGRYLRTIARNFWNLPVLFVLIFAFLTAGTLLLNLFLLARRFPSLWQYHPLAYVTLKITLSVLLFSLAAQLLRLLPLSKNGSFYSAAALFVLFVDIIIFSIINLSLSYYFIWAFALAFLFSILRHRVLKLIALVIAPLLLVQVALEVLAIPEIRVSQLLLLSPRGNLVLSFVTLPFLLMLIRLDFLVRHPVKGRRSFALRLVTIVTAAIAVGLLVFVLVSSPFDPVNPQPITATERVDYESFTHKLSLESPAPLGTFTVTFSGRDEEVATASRNWETSTERVPDVLSVRLSTVDFLDRNQVRLFIDSPLPLEQVRVLLTSDEPMTIYDVDFPYQLAPQRTSAEIFIGRRPPLPVVVNYTTTRDTEPRIEVVAQSSTHPEPLRIEKPQATVTSELIVRTVIGR